MTSAFQPKSRNLFSSLAGRGIKFCGECSALRRIARDKTPSRHVQSFKSTEAFDEDRINALDRSARLLTMGIYRVPKGTMSSSLRVLGKVRLGPVSAYAARYIE